MAYQTWIADLGEWQTDEQIEYDIREMKKLGVNSVRVDFVWKHIEEKGDNQFTWDRYDHLIAVAERYDMKYVLSSYYFKSQHDTYQTLLIRIFALVGYQWPPDWFPGKPFQEGNDVDPGWFVFLC